MIKPRYTKKPNDFNVLKAKLISRGLICASDPVTEQALKYIGYYRLRGYLYPFYIKDMTDPRKPVPQEPKEFQPNTTIEDVLSLYEFDRKLRLIILEEVQKVEVALRTRISEHMCMKYNNSHWFMDMSIVSNAFNHQKFFEQISKAKEVFIQHYQANYETPKYPPSWMIVETLSFGAWSKAYNDLLSEDKKDIAREFNILSSEVLESWLHTLTHLRNLCAHHSRIWNRNFTVFIPRKYTQLEPHLNRGNTVYSRLAVLRYISNQVSISDGMTSRLRQIFQNTPKNVTLEKMGFPENWEQDSLWQ